MLHNAQLFAAYRLQTVHRDEIEDLDSASVSVGVVDTHIGIGGRKVNGNLTCLYTLYPAVFVYGGNRGISRGPFVGKVIGYDLTAEGSHRCKGTLSIYQYGNFIEVNLEAVLRRYGRNSEVKKLRKR